MSPEEGWRAGAAGCLLQWAVCSYRPPLFSLALSLHVFRSLKRTGQGPSPGDKAPGLPRATAVLVPGLQVAAERPPWFGSRFLGTSSPWTAPGHRLTSPVTRSPCC